LGTIQFLEKGAGFGIPTSVVTILAVIAGFSGLNDFSALITAVLIIGVADALSDAFGMHVSEEVEHGEGKRTTWVPVGAFIAKFAVAISFLVIIWVFGQNYLVPSIAWGYTLISVLSWRTAEKHGENPIKAVLQHIAFATVVLIISYGIGVAVGE